MFGTSVVSVRWREMVGPRVGRRMMSSVGAMRRMGCALVDTHQLLLAGGGEVEKT